MRQLLVFPFALMALLAGCATQSGRPTSAGPTGICHVCRYRNDLACVYVNVTEHTPRAEYNGKTYPFCSEDCRSAFLKKPVKYLPK